MNQLNDRRNREKLKSYNQVESNIISKGRAYSKRNNDLKKGTEGSNIKRTAFMSAATCAFAPASCPTTGNGVRAKTAGTTARRRAASGGAYGGSDCDPSDPL
jgi:hypothetical protein